MPEFAQTSAAETAGTPVPLADCTRARQIELRYLKQADALVDDALERQSAEILVDVLTRTLARIAVGYGTTAVSADIIRRLGSHMADLVAQRNAEAEAKAAKKKGIAAH